jgi:hypothetical protein
MDFREGLDEGPFPIKLFHSSQIVGVISHGKVDGADQMFRPPDLRDLAVSPVRGEVFADLLQGSAMV